jgi:hypothetical protein
MPDADPPLTTTPMQGSVPTPDPTKLSTDAINAATSQFRRDLDGLRELIEARLSAMDVATQLHSLNAAEITSRGERQNSQLKELAASNLHNAVSTLEGKIKLVEAATQRVGDVSLEKFSAIDGTFASNALALTAALAAQKEAAAEQNKSGTLAITKSEQTTKETINSNAIQTTASLQSQAALITDVKERVVRIEQSIVNVASNRTEGRDDRTERRGSTQVTTQIIAAVTAVIAIAVILFVGLHNNGSKSSTTTELPSCTAVTTGTACVTTK